MPRLRRVLRREPLALALTAYDLWRRLPKRQRKAVLKLARKHGPALAKRAVKAKTVKKR